MENQMYKEKIDLVILWVDGNDPKWLNEKIHKYGSTRLPKDTIMEVCGKEVTAQPLIRYFKEKYPLK